MRTSIDHRTHCRLQLSKVWQILLLTLGCGLLPGCLFHRHRNTGMAGPVNPGDQPDKILFEKAANEINHGRFDVGRLTLQTLINTYPDSEFLSKAKLEIADSYYRQGGVSGLTQAEAEYKDFITFFPTAPEAPMAEYRAGMAHFRLMGKEDRDTLEADQAEAEFKVFLQKYPDSALMPTVKARLREVQEILAESDYEVAKFYYMRGASKASESRFEEILNKYPNFSEGDHALWYLAQSLERLKRGNEAMPYYARILTDFPLSSHADDAKEKLAAAHVPIPRASQAILARAQADEDRHINHGIAHRMGGAFTSTPDFSATLRGPVYIGGVKPPAVEMAKERPASTVGNLSAQTVGEGSLNSGSAADPKSKGSNPTGPALAKASSPTAVARANGSASKSPGAAPSSEGKTATGADPAKAGNQNTQNASDTSSTQKKKKKKGHLHFLKKLFPF
ncbi:MAG TPA: outer membrane protein assembly factor BamD [Terriglobia bacterium]|nr:outer membrane protein assembly factor BamD [Terriglobia bacterium]